MGVLAGSIPDGATNFMTLQKLVELVKTAPPTQMDDWLMQKLNEVDIEDEVKVRAVLEEIYKSGFYGNVTPFVATLVDPKFTKDYPLK